MFVSTRSPFEYSVVLPAFEMLECGPSYRKFYPRPLSDVQGLGYILFEQYDVCIALLINSIALTSPLACFSIVHNACLPSGNTTPRGSVSRHRERRHGMMKRLIPSFRSLLLLSVLLFPLLFVLPLSVSVSFSLPLLLRITTVLTTSTTTTTAATNPDSTVQAVTAASAGAGFLAFGRVYSGRVTLLAEGEISQFSPVERYGLFQAAGPENTEGAERKGDKLRGGNSSEGGAYKRIRTLAYGGDDGCALHVCC